MKKIYLFSCLIFLCTIKNKGQNNDPLSGYNESIYRQQAQLSNYTPGETKALIERTKQQFLANKLSPVQPNINLKTTNTNTYNPGCVNMDFETGNTNGWVMSSGTTSVVNSSCSLINCCTGSNINYSVMSNGVVDPNVGFTINSQFGGSSTGNKFIRLNDAMPGLDSQRMTQTFLVSSSNNLFLYSFLLVFDGAGHPCCDQPFYNFTLSDTLGNVISASTMPNYSITVPGSGCIATSSLSAITSSLMPTASSFSSTPWLTSAIDLTPYIGNAVRISITAGDCTAGAHAGYMYFDALCGALTYSDNAASLPLNVNNNVVAGPTHTLVAPNGFNTYQWNGPSGIINSKTAVVSLPGTYTLSLGGYGYSGVSQKYFTVAAPNALNTNNALLNALHLYPNPTNSEFVIENVPVKSNYTLLDITGKTIINKTENTYGNVKVDVSGFEKGVYFLKLETEVGVRNFKVVKE